MRRALGALAVATTVTAVLTITPARNDFGKTLVRTGVALRQFTLSSTPGDSLFLSITGPHAAEFNLLGGSDIYCLDSNYNPTPSCKIDLDFRPQSVGIKTATLLATNRRGQRATASLHGEGIANVGCQPVLVDCNYVGRYSGSIQIVSVDTVSTNDHKVRDDIDINISVVNGVVTCTGLRREHERLGYRDRFETERKGTGAIAGSGMLAIEFEFDGGKPVYVLTYACPAPKMNRTSTDLISGNSENESFPGSPADWRNSERVADPQPSTGPGMPLLKGWHTNTRWDRANSAGGITKTMWELRLVP